MRWGLLWGGVVEVGRWRERKGFVLLFGGVGSESGFEMYDSFSPLSLSGAGMTAVRCLGRGWLGH